VRSDESGVAEAALDDLDAQAAHCLDVRGVPYERGDLEIAVSLDKDSKDSA